MDYSNFRLEDFLVNRDFIQWATSSKEDRDTFWHKWIENHPEQRDTIYEARKIVRNLHFGGMQLQEADYEAVLGNILSGKHSSSRTWIDLERREKRHFTYSLMKLAASLLLIVGLVSYLVQVADSDHFPVQVAGTKIVKTAMRGQKLTITLPDSSVVKLNSESSITYSSNFDDVRFVTLEGEAFFEVVHRDGSPFTVQSPNLSTTVLGTSFNIRAYPKAGLEAVSLVSGKVRVQKNSEKERPPVELSPREKLQFNKSTGSMSFVTYHTSEVLWKDGTLVFRDSDLSDFVKTIERWYDVEVTVQGTPRDNWLINGRFKDEALELVLESLKFAEKINYSIDGNNVVIKI